MNRRPVETNDNSGSGSTSLNPSVDLLLKTARESLIFATKNETLAKESFEEEKNSTTDV